jgi:cytochrome c oxidase cbb3-type subunit 3
LKLSAKHALLVILLVAAALPVRGHAEEPDGAELFRQHCAVCHGVEGDGGVGIPLDLPDFLAVASDDYLRLTLRLGRPGRVMPAFTSFDDEQIDAIVAHIRSWSDQPAPQYDRSVLGGDPQRGERLYGRHCVGCHGDDGQGSEGTGVTFSRPRQLPVMGPALGNPGFQASASDAMLKASLIRGREGTPMPSLRSLGLENSDADDLVAYLRTLARAAPAADGPESTPVIRAESPYGFEQTLEALRQAVIGRNFRVIREQFLEQGLVPEGRENDRQVMLYFCNFSFLNEALAIDPRVGLFLPCRVTVLETARGVEVMSINPKNLSRLFNNRQLDRACDRMHRLYTGIIEEATL